MNLLIPHSNEKHSLYSSQIYQDSIEDAILPAHFSQQKIRQQRQLYDKEQIILESSVKMQKLETLKTRYAILTFTRLLLFASQEDYLANNLALSVYPLLNATVQLYNSTLILTYAVTNQRFTLNGRERISEVSFQDQSKKAKTSMIKEILFCDQQTASLWEKKIEQCIQQMQSHLDQRRKKVEYSLYQLTLDNETNPPFQSQLFSVASHQTTIQEDDNHEKYDEQRIIKFKSYHYQTPRMFDYNQILQQEEESSLTKGRATYDTNCGGIRNDQSQLITQEKTSEHLTTRIQLQNPFQTASTQQISKITDKIPQSNGSFYDQKLINNQPSSQIKEEQKEDQHSEEDEKVEYHQLVETLANHYLENSISIEQITLEEYSKQRINTEFNYKQQRQSFDYSSLDLQMRTAAPERVFEIVLTFIQQNENNSDKADDCEQDDEISETIAFVLAKFKNQLIQQCQKLINQIKESNPKNENNVDQYYIIQANILKNDIEELKILYDTISKQYPKYFGIQNGDDKNIDKQDELLRTYHQKLTLIDSLRLKRFNRQGSGVFYTLMNQL